MVKEAVIRGHMILNDLKRREGGKVNVYMPLAGAAACRQSSLLPTLLKLEAPPHAVKGEVLP